MSWDEFCRFERPLRNKHILYFPKYQPGVTIILNPNT